MFDERAYWLWLQHAFGAGSSKAVSVYKRFHNLQEFFEGGKSLWSSMSFISDKDLNSLSEYTPSHAEAMIEYSIKAEQKIISYSCDKYPEKLRNISAPPAILFAKGDIPNFDEIVTITVVGSRDADAKAIEATEGICYDLSKKGTIVVSGGALGIDAASHRGSLRGIGINTCVLACGLDYPYLMQNAMLRKQIVSSGDCLLTEYPIHTGVFKGSFNVRNRIMSGLCDGLLVVKAKKKSGTMITVAHATKQNKDIFAIPGDISDPYSQGPNALIQDGAVPVLKADDILDTYYGRKLERANPKVQMEKAKSDPQNMSENLTRIYSCVPENPVSLSDISEQTGISFKSLQASLLQLELKGYIKTLSGQRYYRL